MAVNVWPTVHRVLSWQPGNRPRWWHRWLCVEAHPWFWVGCELMDGDETWVSGHVTRRGAVRAVGAHTTYGIRRRRDWEGER